MTYRIDLCSTTGFDTEVALFTPSDIMVERWSKRINAAGRLVFSMHKFHPKATDANLRMYRRVRLYRNGVPIWLGFIEAKKEFENEIQISCVGMLDLFTKRYTAADEAFSGQGSTEAFGLLTDTNTNDQDTGVVAGTGGVTTTKSLTLDSVEILRAWEEIAQAHNAEFEINEDGEFRFVPSLGTDQSAVVELIFRRDGTPGSNIDEIEIGEDGKPMANRAVGLSSASGGLSSTQNDATSQSTYGLLIERKVFNEAQDQGTLDSMTTAYLTQRANPITDFRLVPSLATKKFNPTTGTRVSTGLEYDDVSVGDLVSVTIISGNQNTSESKRIAEIAVDVDENGKETMRYTLSKAGVFVTAALLNATEIDDMKARLRELEAAI